MGLDIYFYKVKKSNFTNEAPTTNECYESAKKQYTEEFSKAYDSAIENLSSVSDEEYNQKYIEECKRLLKFFNYPFLLSKIGVREEDEIIPCTLTEFIKEKDDILKGFFPPHIAYFRKVNFLYKFFEHKIDDESQSAMVTREDLETLISYCERILNAKDEDKVDIAKELLPTRSGFFFGSIDYNEWYFYDVKDVMSKMKNLLNYIDDNFIWVVFSW